MTWPESPAVMCLLRVCFVGKIHEIWTGHELIDENKRLFSAFLLKILVKSKHPVACNAEAKKNTINPRYTQSGWISPTTPNHLLSDHQCRCGRRGTEAEPDNSPVPAARFVAALQPPRKTFLLPSFVPVHPVRRGGALVERRRGKGGEWLAIVQERLRGAGGV